MKIVNLRVRNFRSFGDKPTEIIFGDGVNLIVGENNVGKSAILKSLDLLKGEYSLTPNDYYKGEGNRELQIEGEAKLSKAELQSFANPFAIPYQMDKEKVKRITSAIGNKIRFAYSSKRGYYLRFKKLHISGDGAEMISNLGKPGDRASI